MAHRRGWTIATAECDSGRVKGKHLAIGLLIALFGLVGVIFWFGATGDRSEPVHPRRVTTPPARVIGDDGRAPIHDASDPGSP